MAVQRLLAVFGVLAFCSLINGETVFVQQLCRHGDRAPTSYYPNYPEDQQEYWIQGRGALTPTGMQQTYANGVAFRKNYPNLLSEIWQPNEIKVISSTIDRAIQSANAFLAGLYPPVGAFNFEPDLNWQSLPVHTMSPSVDYYLYGHFPCPPFWDAVNAVESTAEYTQFIYDNMDFMDMIGGFAGYQPRDRNPKAMGQINDCFICNTAHNLSLPHWATPVVQTRILNIVNQQATFWYTSPEINHLDTGGGPLIGLMVNNIVEKLKGLNPYNFMFYSAHDTTLQPFTGSLGLPVGPNPPVASCYLVELNQNDSNAEYYVNLYYKNTTAGEYLQPRTIPACGEFDCPLDKLISLATNVINYDPPQSCQVDQDIRDILENTEELGDMYKLLSELRSPNDVQHQENSM